MGLSLAVAAVDGLDGTASFNRDLALAVKRDGTWVQAGLCPPGSDWTRSTNEIVYNQAIDVENTTASNQSFTEACIIASQDLGQTISFLNTDQTAVDNLLGGIETLAGSPITIQPGQKLRFTSLRIPIV